MQNYFRGITMQQVSMVFGEKPALRDVTLQFREGTIHSIVGENGAGKSTLMHILSGVLQPSAGQVLINGQPVQMKDPTQAVAHGIGMVHQHFMLVPMLRVWQNVILGNEPRKGLEIDTAKAKAEIQRVCEEYNIDIDIEKEVGTLTVGEQQRVEILKVLYRDAKYIILDEPTAVLTPQETAHLLENIVRLRSMGKTILFISHKLEEVMGISDEISVLRLGQAQQTLPAAQATKEQVVSLMVGRSVDLGTRVPNPNLGPVKLDVQKISTLQEGYGCRLDSLSLTVRSGEIHGIAGVDGNGQLELVQALLGMRKLANGNADINGKSIAGLSTGQIRALGLSCVAPDRHTQGLVLEQSILRNAVLGIEDDPRLRKGLFIHTKALEAMLPEVLEKYDVRYAGLGQKIRYLSGGNQQKVILARECELRQADLILAVNPTRGLDIGATEFVYSCFNSYKLAGKAILLISTELSEVLTLSDRVSVLYKGRILDTLENDNLDVQQVGSLMAGIRPERAG